MTGQGIAQTLALILLAPLIGALIAYIRSYRSKAVVLNGFFLLLFLAASGFAMLSNPTTRVNASAACFYLVIAVVSLLSCAAGFRFQRFQSVLFWLVWPANFLILVGLFYLAFMWRIQF